MREREGQDFIKRPEDTGWLGRLITTSASLELDSRGVCCNHSMEAGCPAQSSFQESRLPRAPYRGAPKKKSALSRFSKVARISKMTSPHMRYLYGMDTVRIDEIPFSHFFNLLHWRRSSSMLARRGEGGGRGILLPRCIFLFFFMAVDCYMVLEYI
ncbi:hypothetical protein B0T19DRAFT_140508 [Cercophora scortea]|uniref:Uncharacterized protein n=1 Tax=Cercophora scortea TaxID=314031 RepID=A0AAE0MIQ0_9PEZI|nr:hypothetical protein B0T19DRAFT_140508 [Cercophora scortea]